MFMKKPTPNQPKKPHKATQDTLKGGGNVSLGKRSPTETKEVRIIMNIWHTAANIS